MERFLTTLLALSLAGGLLTALLLGLERLLGQRIPARAMYAAWLLVLLRLLLPVPGLVSLPAARTTTPAAAVAAADAAPRSVAPVEATDPGRTGGPEATLPEAAHSAAPTEEEPTPAAPRSVRSVSPWTLGFWIWAAGAVLCLGVQLWAYFRFRRALFRSLRSPCASELSVLSALNPRPWPVLRRSAAAESPLLLGLLRPVIVLPDRDYTPEELDGILRHELCHWRRGDLAVKWLAAAVHALHWFNPLLLLLRRGLDRACELKCDALLLRDMDREERQRYGELLLSLAAARPLSRGLVAVSFATEKRDLKERLVHIMKFKHTDRAVLCLALAALLLLGGCAAAIGPAAVPAQTKTEPEAASLSASEPTADRVDEPIPTASPEIDPDNGPVLYADSVDAFLSALGSDRAIALLPGVYDLTTASDYGGAATASYSWAQVGDGWELVLDRLENLVIYGTNGADSVSLVTQPRYANVLRFEGCRSVVLDGVTAGHTPEQGTCRGGVLKFNDCDDVTVGTCDLYGCGSIGIEAVNSRRIAALDTTIRECSYGALKVQNSYDFRFERGFIRDCGLKTADGCYNLLDAVSTTGFRIVNTEITGNRAQLFLADAWSAEVKLLGCLAYDNEFHEGMRILGAAPVVVGCGLGGNVAEERLWYVDPAQTAVDADGRAMTPSELERMEWNRYEVDPEGITMTTFKGPEGTVGEDGITEYHVTTVDEFLACIGSNTRIYLDGERFDLAEATTYGGYGGAHYYWQATYDGPGLVICDAENLSIIGQGKNATSFETAPRYADVLGFYNCTGCTVSSLTAGHTKGAGGCMGDVIAFRDCADCTVEFCGLFGCGVNGVSAAHSTGLLVRYTEIYECSGFGAVLEDSEAEFLSCLIRDCGSDEVLRYGESSATWDGKALES